jgi:hypothetical protein
MIDVAILTGGGDVFTCQFEGGQVMVKGGRSPRIGGVAGAALGAKTILMDIFCCVAGNAGRGCALKNMIDMTICAGNIDVLTGQFEGGQIMVKRGRCPTSGGVAGTAIGAKPSQMDVFY